MPRDRAIYRVALFVAAVVLSASALRAADKVEVDYKPDIIYATVDSEQLQLDIAAPKGLDHPLPAVLEPVGLDPPLVDDHAFLFVVLYDAGLLRGERSRSRLPNLGQLLQLILDVIVEGLQGGDVGRLLGEMGGATYSPNVNPRTG